MKAVWGHFSDISQIFDMFAFFRKSRVTSMVMIVMTVMKVMFIVIASALVCSKNFNNEFFSGKAMAIAIVMGNSLVPMELKVCCCMERPGGS